MCEKVTLMDIGRIDQQAARLRQAREMRGFSSAKEAARRFGWNYNTYSQHERGHVGITRASKEYARKFRVREAWLLTGEGSPEDPFADEELRTMFERLAAASPEVRRQVLSYAEFALDNFEKSRDTATKPAA
jgi:transcriptional regulator with XRE-family HTH domain